GVNSAWADSLNDRGRFAAVGKSIEFLWENIGLPYSRTVSQQVIDGTAIFALEDVRINDRAHVVRSTAPFTGAPVSANGAIRLGVEALVGAVRAKGRITLIAVSSFLFHRPSFERQAYSWRPPST